jgi:PTS system nitrogen regulatory IIA component
MDQETMDLEQLATYLQRDVREVTKLASRGYLPGQKVGGEWRFASAEINYWISTQMHAYTEAELTKLEVGAGQERQLDRQPLVAGFLSESTMSVELPASTKASVLKELVSLAEQSWQVYDPQALLEAIKQREEMSSTATDNGVALPHPRRPNPNILGESVVAFGRTPSGIPFGGPHGALSDLFFLVCCRDHTTHLAVLARLSRLLLRPGFAEELRAAATVSDAYHIIEASERDLIAE